MTAVETTEFFNSQEIATSAGYARILTAFLERTAEDAGMEWAVRDQPDAQGPHGGMCSSSMVRTARL